MTRGSRGFTRDDGGQTVVLLAVSMPLLLALLLLVIDAGRLYVDRERLIGAARLSAQAGTSALMESAPGGRTTTDAQVRAVVQEAIARNLPGEAVRSAIDIDRSKQAVSVRLDRQVEAFFGRVSVPVAGSFSTATDLAPASGTGTRAAISPAPVPSAVAAVPSALVSPSPTPSPTPVPGATCYSVGTTQDAWSFMMPYRPQFLINGSPSESLRVVPGTTVNLALVLKPLATLNGAHVNATDRTVVNESVTITAAGFQHLYSGGRIEWGFKEGGTISFNYWAMLSISPRAQGC